MVQQEIVLGHVISSKGIEVDKSKLEIISKLPPPRNIKDVRSFLGHTGFYRRFIENFSSITLLMTNLLKSDVSFVWND